MDLLTTSVGALAGVIGAAVTKWGPALIRLLTEWLQARKELRLRSIDAESAARAAEERARAKEREDTLQAFRELGSWQARTEWLYGELQRERAARQHLEAKLATAERKLHEAELERARLRRDLETERGSRQRLEERAKALEDALERVKPIVLEYIGPAPAAASAAEIIELKGRPRRD